MTCKNCAAPFAAGRYSDLAGTGSGEMAQWCPSVATTEPALKGGVRMVERAIVLNVRDIDAHEVKNVRSAKKERHGWLSALWDVAIYFFMICCLIFAAAMLM